MLTIVKQIIDNIGLEHIKAFEGYRDTAYKPHPDDVWTIGYGHTAGVYPGQKITKSEADQFLLDDIQWAEAVVHQYVQVPLDQNQHNALVSFIFNVGETAFRRSTLLKELNKGHYNKVDHQLMRWVYSGGKKFKGLVNRRKAEADLFTDFKPRFIAVGAMPQSVEADKTKSLSKTIVDSRTAKSGLTVAGVGGYGILDHAQQAAEKVNSIWSSIGETMTDQSAILPLLLLVAGAYIIYLKFSDVQKGRSY